MLAPRSGLVFQREDVAHHWRHTGSDSTVERRWAVPVARSATDSGHILLRAPLLAMLQLDRISHAFGGRALFHELSWQLHPGARIGLVGPNGAGKTTLFRILSGELKPDSGRVVRPRDLSIGLLPQDVGDLGEAPVLEHVLGGRADLIDEEKQLQGLRVAIERAVEESAPPDRLEKLSLSLAEREDAFRQAGGYRVHADAAAILTGMGFPPAVHQRPCDSFSGGWRVRIVLSRLLLQRPDVLLMDEPTNHLDVPSVEWLEGFLSTYEGTVVVISHDRYFLNRLVTEIAGLESDGLHVHRGDWDAYMAAREERAATLEARKAQQDRQLRDAERFIERFRSKATKARQVQSRIRALEKVERIETDASRADIHFRFPEADRPGRIVAEARQLARAYGTHTVFADVELRIERGERVALVGPNGAGKSTLLRLLAGADPPTAGEVIHGHGVLPGYFAQHSVDTLDVGRTLLQEMEAAATDRTFPLCRSILGAFLFSGDDVEKRISVLSGGERNRVALARMLLRPANLLLLDEPTNHLDMASRDVLVDALKAFGGTVIFVSHDRHFINAIATRVLHIEDGRLDSYPGDYEYYRFKRREEGLGTRTGLLADHDPDAIPRTDQPSGGSVPPDGATISRRDQKRIEAQWRNDMNRATRALRDRVTRIESDLAQAEARRDAIEARLADPALYASDASQAGPLQAELATVSAEIESMMETWETAAAELEAGEANWQQTLAERLAQTGA